MISMQRLIACVVAGTAIASPLQAQSILDAGLRAGPQFVQYTLKSPLQIRISEFAVPVYASMPLTSRLTIDVGTAWASSQVEPSEGAGEKSSISGLTDTQLRGSYTFGADAVVLTLGLNIPTGTSTANVEQLTAATLIGNDFLALPVTNFGTGFGTTGGVAVARHAGDWNLGFGASFRRSEAYNPFEDEATGTRFRYEPGNEYRGRLGADRLVGAGRLTMGLTYSTFGEDIVGGSVYNTGDRWVAQLGYSGGMGPGELTLAAWDLYRGAGELADGTATGYDQIANVLVAYGMRGGSALVEPNVEVRNWQAKGSLPSTIVNLGVRTQLSYGSLSISPAVRYGVGKFGTTAGSADLNGFQGILSIGIQR